MIEKAIKDLKDMLPWSDRLGSDEHFEIQNIIERLQLYANSNKTIKKINEKRV